MAGKNIAVVGATGAVGVEMLHVLDKLDVEVANLKLLASGRSAGKTMEFKGEPILVEETRHDSFNGVDIALFSAGSSISREYEKSVVDAGAVLIDNSSAFRMKEGVPLVVPEVNPEDAHKHNGVIANPNCSTIIMLMAVFPIHQKYPVKRIVVSTYQAASGAGWEAMEELKEGSLAYLEGKSFEYKKMPHPYAFNLFSHNSPIVENGYNEEENKMVLETKKILHNDAIQIAPTAVRVPIFRAHSESINLEFEGKAPETEEVRVLLDNFPGVKVVDERSTNIFPMPLHASGQFDCLVGRIRKDQSQPDKGIELFVAGDQLLKGAALNAVQIAQLLI